MNTVGFSVFSILFVVIGYLVSIILFVIGIVRGLLKKGWKLVGYSFLLFIFIFITSGLLNYIYRQNFRPAVIQNLQEVSTPKLDDVTPTSSSGIRIVR